MSLTSLPVSSPDPEPAPNATFELLAGGQAAFARILKPDRRSPAAASWSAAFEWRDDDTGRAVARALLGGRRPRRRGDNLEGPHRRLLRAPRGDEAELLPQEDQPARAGTALVPDDVLRPLGLAAQSPSELATALLAHPNVTLHEREAVRPRQALPVRRRDGDPGRDGDRRRLPRRERRLHGRDLRAATRPSGWPRATRGAPASTPDVRSTTCCTRFAGRPGPPSRSPRSGSS